MRRKSINDLYYITHIDNLPSILNCGILSHACIETENIQFTPIYDKEIVDRRHDITTPDGRNLWNFANLYFQPRNAMLYRVIFHGESIDKDDIAILAVRPDILNRKDIFISTGNAAHSLSTILPANEGKKILSQIKKDIDNEYWKEEDGSKRKMMAECLVPDVIPRDFIQSVYIASPDNIERVISIIQKSNPLIIPEVIPEPRMFFQPFKRIALTPHLTLVEGDMFFSRMHTLTVSVNCRGIMGKGLASRAKYQFPDVYVFYQDLCRTHILQMGKPSIYKREYPSDNQLIDEPSISPSNNSEMWFLLFPTKRHWKENSDIYSIKEGLQWLLDNYKKEGIKSLAIPALGCGLGKLNWREVGPIMCRYLSSLDISVELYLPVEREIPADFLTKDFLLNENS